MQKQVQRDRLEVDALIVGAGPAGLATAIRLKQIDPDIDVYVLEKASQPGAHTLSGALIDPRGLNELFPNWQNMDPPIKDRVVNEEFAFLSKKNYFGVPNWLLPSSFSSINCYAGSLGDLVVWLAQQAEAMGVQIFSGYCAAQLLLENNQVIGVITGDMGISKDGEPSDRYQPGIEITSPYTVFAEGCRGHLGRELEQKFNLREGVDPQSYALGIKELWRVTGDKHLPGSVRHTAGWPLDRDTYGGGFVYHYGDKLLSVGFVTGLDYRNPNLNPYREFQRWKLHPSIRPTFDQAERISYGARSIAAGGLQSLPKIIFPGGLLVGCEAGFLNAARIKGTHTAIKSGLIAASCIAEALQLDKSKRPMILEKYPEQLAKSWIYRELNATRNFKPWMAKGLISGSIMYGFEQLILRGKVPWTLNNKASNTSLQKTCQSKSIDYPPTDGKVSFDRLSSVFLSNTHHEEDQPIHLHLKQANIAIDVNWKDYGSPEQNYCPAGVYEIINPDSQQPSLQINAQNCLHCKACDIKDPTENIVWQPPQGGEGPVYRGM